MKKLIIIPAYNESEAIEKTIEDIRANVPDFDYIIVNDCSADQTKSICEKNGYSLLDLPINLGIGGAVQTGYSYALQGGYDIAVQVDGDGQHDVRFLDAMVEQMQQTGSDMVIGSRFIKKEGFQSSAVRRLGITWFTFLIRLLTGTVITDPTSGFRMANRKVIARFAAEYPRDYPEPESVVALLTNGSKVTEVPVQMRERQGGVSSIHLKRSIYYMIKVSLAILVEWIRK